MQKEEEEEADFRIFFFEIFNDDLPLRRKILKQWHSPYSLNVVPLCGTKQHTRLSHVFEEFISLILYAPIVFKARADHFCLFGGGTEKLAVRHEWLNENALTFLCNRASPVALRQKVFKQRHLYENNQYSLEEFVYNPTSAPLTPLISYNAICDLIWQREIIRDFAWMCLAQKHGFIVKELIVAMQMLMLENKDGKKDIFLATLHAGVQGTVNIYEVPCWGLSKYDLHPEDAYQREKYKESNAIKNNVY